MTITPVASTGVELMSPEPSGNQPSSGFDVLLAGARAADPRRGAGSNVDGREASPDASTTTTSETAGADGATAVTGVADGTSDTPPLPPAKPQAEANLAGLLAVLAALAWTPPVPTTPTVTAPTGTPTDAATGDPAPTMPAVIDLSPGQTTTTLVDLVQATAAPATPATPASPAAFTSDRAAAPLTSLDAILASGSTPPASVAATPIEQVTPVTPPAPQPAPPTSTPNDALTAGRATAPAPPSTLVPTPTVPTVPTVPTANPTPPVVVETTNAPTLVGAASAPIAEYPRPTTTPPGGPLKTTTIPSGIAIPPTMPPVQIAPATMSDVEHVAAAAPPPPADQLVSVLTPLRTTTNGSYTLRLELKPPELGRVELRVEMKDGVLHASIHTDREGSAQLLRDALGGLRDRLEAEGVRTGDLTVSDGGVGSRDRDAADARSPAEPPSTPAVNSAAGPAPVGLIDSDPDATSLLDVRI